MKKPNNYDEKQLISQEYVPVELGGHLGIIKSVEERQTRTGKDMIVVCIDFDNKDRQPHYFENMYAQDDRPSKKWPNAATQYIVTEDNEGNCSTAFKSFCVSFEKSNHAAISWTIASWGNQFKGKKIGVVFGEVEEEYNGEVKTRRRIRWICEYDKATEQRIPAKKGLPRSGDDSGFMPIPDAEELPFG